MDYENDLRNDIETKTRVLSLEKAIRKIPSSSSIMVGGFGITGIPQFLLKGLIEQDNIKDLTIISNNINRDTNLHPLFKQKRIKKAIGTYFTTNKEVVKAYERNEIEIDLLPQGTFIEAIRLGGAGIAAFYTPTGIGTELSVGKETKEINGNMYLLEESLKADVALIKAYKADRAGNVIYRKSARNFNPAMATAAKLTIVEVEEIVEVGELNPEEIITPFIFVDILVKREGDNDDWI